MRLENAIDFDDCNKPEYKGVLRHTFKKFLLPMGIWERKRIIWNGESHDEVFHCAGFWVLFEQPLHMIIDAVTNPEVLFIVIERCHVRCVCGRILQREMLSVPMPESLLQKRPEALEDYYEPVKCVLTDADADALGSILQAANMDTLVPFIHFMEAVKPDLWTRYANGEVIDKLTARMQLAGCIEYQLLKRLYTQRENGVDAFAKLLAAKDPRKIHKDNGVYEYDCQHTDEV